MTTTANAETAVLEVAGVLWASEKAVVEAVLGHRPGVLAVQANPVAQTATITYDPTGPRSPIWQAGSATAATTAKAARCPSTCATPCSKQAPSTTGNPRPGPRRPRRR